PGHLLRDTQTIDQRGIRFLAEIDAPHIGSHRDKTLQYSRHDFSVTGCHQIRQVLDWNAELVDGRKYDIGGNRVKMPVESVDDRAERRNIPYHRHCAVFRVE